MPILTWSHLCDYAALDASGKAAIIGDFDRIWAPEMPWKHPMMHVISKWSGVSGEQFAYQARVVSPAGQLIAEIPEHMVSIPDFGDGMGHVIALHGFLMVALPVYGEYSVDLLCGGNPVSILPFKVQAPPVAPV